MISIIIPTLDASGSLPGLLTKLQQQTVKEKEIIIVDSSSGDDTLKIAESFGARTISIPEEQFDHGETRNIGAKEAKGDIVVFLTQDAVPVDEYALQNLIKPLNGSSDIAAAFGRQLPNPDARPVASHLRMFNYPESSYVRCLEDRSVYGIRTTFLSNSFSAYRRAALEGIGWFGNHIIWGEDTHAAAQLLLSKYKIAYASDAMVYHSHDYTPVEEFRRYFDVGVFHRTEDWIIHEFGRAQGEGRKYIQSGISYLVKQNKFIHIPSFIFRNALKYIGYNLGLRYAEMPNNLASRFSLNRKWWKRTLIT